MIHEQSAVVLLSGGVDSATCVGIARRKHSTVFALSIDYGQKAKPELQKARFLAERFECQHIIISGLDFSTWGGSCLTDAKIDIPPRKSTGVGVTYVPARNTVLIGIAASVAESVGARYVYIGVHSDDYEGYPDCRPEYIGAMKAALFLGTGAGINLIAPLQYMNKAEIINLSRTFGITYEETWSCYAGGGVPCGVCSSCRNRLQAEKIADSMGV